jgi:acyl-CoA thioester hydrolase
VRSYELDSNGHVNNAVYLGYAEEVATLHAEALGLGRAWAQGQGGMWVVHRHEITYVTPAGYGDDLELRTTVESMRGARAVRRTTMHRTLDRRAIAEIRTEWVWVRASDSRPARLPPEAIAAFASDQCASVAEAAIGGTTCAGAN